MKLLMFAFFDTKTGNYLTPFFMNHVGAATRAAGDLGADNNTMIGRHPADYQLHQLGGWEDQNGAYQPEFVNLGSVVTFMPRPGPVTPLLQPSSDAIEPIRRAVAMAGTPEEDR